MRWRKRSSIGNCCSLLILLLAGCATKPVAYVGLYGEYRDEVPAISRILSQYDLELRTLEADPPAGVHNSAVIHGNGAAATKMANDIAYSLYETFGTWVMVRPVTITNHSYSTDFIGIYLLSPDFASKLNQAEVAELAVVPTSSYEAQNCENFAVLLTLEPTGRYKVQGLQFDSDDIASPVSIDGNYRLDDDGLDIDYSGEMVGFRRERIQHSDQEPIMRDKYIPIDTQSQVESVFSCSFLQELDVVARQ
jgi:hypothetical protein